MLMLLVSMYRFQDQLLRHLRRGKIRLLQQKVSCSQRAPLTVIQASKTPLES